MKGISLSILCCFVSITIQAQLANIYGKIIDKETKEVIPFANIILKQNDDVAKGTTSNFEGQFAFHFIELGKYDLEISYVGYATKVIKEVLLSADNLELDIELDERIEVTCCCYFYPHHPNLFEIDDPSLKRVFRREEILNSAAW